MRYSGDESKHMVEAVHFYDSERLGRNRYIFTAGIQMEGITQ
jgi:hypothetical protein